MKTYLLQVPQMLRKLSKQLDTTAILCDKSWIVFNDEGVKILFIFQSDGTLLVSQNGVVTNQTWSYIKANASLVINNNGQSYLLHPAFMDDIIFALQQDGTEHHLFMIDEAHIGKIQQFTLEYLNQYFTSKVLQIEEEEERSRKQIEERREKERISRIIDKELKPLTTKYKIWYYMPLFVCLIFGVGPMLLADLLMSNNILMLTTIFGGLLTCIVLIILIERLRVDRIKKEIDQKRSLLWQRYLND